MAEIVNLSCTFCCLSIRNAVLRSENGRQLVYDVRDGGIDSMTLPSPSDEVLPGLRWGSPDELFTAAFWASQVWFRSTSEATLPCMWSGDLRGEVIACLLGGHGITWDMNQAAFLALSRSGLFDCSDVKAGDIAEVLRQPIESLNGNQIRYRFPNRRSVFVAEALRRLQHDALPTDNASDFRQALLTFSGIGLKTASWITRNYLNSPLVAIIDIHVFRAGVLMGLYSGSERLPHDYLRLEAKYLEFAAAAALDPRQLDLVIWSTMQRSPMLVRRTLGVDSLTRPRQRTYSRQMEVA
jgi:N-glycosylase/DNA lyase